MVPDEGIEPPTFGLQNRCSTAELIRLGARATSADRAGQAVWAARGPDLAGNPRKMAPPGGRRVRNYQQGFSVMQAEVGGS